MNRFAKALLVAALVGVVGMAFRVSWNALRDVARTVGADDTAALLYPFVVDGLMALALVATLVLTGKDKTFALRVLAGYTVASLILNYVHGLVPALHGGGERMQLADWDPANWVLVLLATSLPVGSIFFGSDLVAKVLHHRPAPITDQDESEQPTTNRLGSDLHESTTETPPAVAELPAPELADPVPVIEPVAAVELAPLVEPVKAVAAVESAPRRATGRVPESARTPRPTRTPDELLAEARSVTADWSDGELTAEAIRKAVRTSSANGRTLRDALKAERAEPDDGAEATAA
ncbi:DUF2637 domain-containing protein [Streptomyces europaeiscabiei]|uniref:DUF2637 domain-containing protein n=1 Tax=Streptomyces europaeiscabiei TaxID=146819 RepID=UPI0029A89B9B|nr:DUF2637 domain-containing protein [Streptomyces europaeiscabiei]MDX2770891.1 DUF2637 domain-containing protein [Streptomyces europaeiscabiei]